jgi:truncated hemoglobin YjbI
MTSQDHDYDDATGAAGFIYQTFPALHPERRRHKSHPDIIAFYRSQKGSKAWQAKVVEMMEAFGSLHSFHSPFNRESLARWLADPSLTQPRYRPVLEALYDSLT